MKQMVPGPETRLKPKALATQFIRFGDGFLCIGGGISGGVMVAVFAGRSRPENHLSQRPTFARRALCPTWLSGRKQL